MRTVRGKVLKYGDNINTDDIMNNAHTALVGSLPQDIGRYCLLNYDPTFVQRAKPGDVLVAGRNFGCGSSKPAALALLGAGIQCVVAVSFSRLFFRNAINLGLLPIESAECAAMLSEGDQVEIDGVHGLLRNLTSGETCPLPAYPPMIDDMIACGGIVGWIRAGHSFEDEGGRAQ